MKQFAPILAAAAVAVSTSFPAAASEELAKKHNCLACHSLDKKVVGPSYKEVAVKKRRDKNAGTKPFQKVKKRGGGAKGEVPMAPDAPGAGAGPKAAGEGGRWPKKAARR